MARITDVARRAGVSPSTVSYALSGKRPISDATRRRVEAAVRELGYRPYTDPRARGDAGSRVLALALPLRAAVHLPVVMGFATSVVAAARTYDHDVLLLTREEDGHGAWSAADALIVMDVQPHDPRLPWLRTLGRPAVLIGLPAEPDGLTCIDLDFHAAGEACVEHLAGLGHRVVALVGSPPEAYVRQTAFAPRVVSGFTAAADRAGLLSSVHPCGSAPEAAAEAARGVAERLLRAQPAPTGVVVHNEPLLEPLIDAFERLGLRVPGDLSVAAICPDEHAAAVRVPVTAVAVPAAEAGTRAVELVMRKLAGAPVPRTTLLAPRLTIRASTAAVRV
ncbi:LacI family DNA-binding transcriptional regulator [Streptomyces lancefieldiae]|uniref:LacI family DNA-binding transcriptional regulator n=1 Tax=Streptomyces lancefieldiae TaxID=3075520 RepID=A0ABU3ATY8_9ACTN|nr:LacI family DNA-binding transcriptional regulator [Streptomyces sp. DSM 40712]MDT0613067.1 LacI family DNA-binding transcriptional regulator [Streptomyces sp. DSM 40712]